MTILTQPTHVHSDTITRFIPVDFKTYSNLICVKRRNHIRIVTGESATVIICKRTNKIIAAWCGFERFVKVGRI